MSDYGEDDYDDNDLGYDYIYVEDDYAAAVSLYLKSRSSPCQRLHFDAVNRRCIVRLCKNPS